MSKVFQSRIDGSFFNYISKIWDRLPQEDRDFLVEYWRGLLRASSDEYLHYLQVEANNGLLTINPYEVRKWRSIPVKRDVLHSLEASSVSTDFSLSESRAILRSGNSFGGAAVSPISPSVLLDGALWFRAYLSASFSGKEEFFLGASGDSVKIGLSIGNLSIQDLVPVTDAVLEKFIVREEITGTLLGTVISDRVGLRSTIPDDLKTLLENGDRVAVVLHDPGTGDDDIVEIKGVSSDGTALVFQEQTKFPDSTVVSGVYYLIVGDGSLSYGISSSSYDGSSLLLRESLRGETLVGGQIGLHLGQGSVISEINLELSSISDLNARFDVLHSPNNGEGTWTNITPPAGVPLEQYGTSSYRIVLDTNIGKYIPSGWVKIVSKDPTLQWDISSTEAFPLTFKWKGKGLGSGYSSWASSSTSDITAKALIQIGERTFLFPVNAPSGFDPFIRTEYEFRYLGDSVEVLIGGVSTELGLSLDALGAELSQWEASYLSGGSQSNSSLTITEFNSQEFNIDDRIVEIPALYDKYERQEMVLLQGEDYTIPDRALLSFQTLDPFLLDQDYLVAEYVSYTGRRIEGIYGKAIGLEGEDSPEFKNKVVAIWGSLLEGPLIDAIKKGIHAIVGLPIALTEGFVTADPTEDSIEIDGKLIKFPSPVGVAVNPRTGEPYKKGDYVAEFSILAGGVSVKDAQIQRDWWYGRKFAGSFNELQKYHTFEVEIDDSLIQEGEIQEIKEFLDRIRKLGDNFFVISSVNLSESMVLESNQNRTELLNENRNRVFVGDSSDPAMVCTSVIKGNVFPNLLGDEIFGSMDEADAQALGIGFTYGLEGAGIGNPIDAYLSGASVLESGSGSFSGVTLTDPLADFSSVTDRDWVEINEKYVFPVAQVTSSASLDIPGIYAPTIASLSSPVQYRILSDPTSASLTPLTTSYFVESNMKIPSGSLVEIEADGKGSSTVMIGTKQDNPDGSWPSYSASEVANAFVYNNGESRIPGTEVFIRELGIDRRELGVLELVPSVVCIKTKSKKGFNSYLSVKTGSTDGHIYLGFPEGDNFGRVTFPGLEHVTFDGTEVSGQEPDTAAIGGSGPYLVSERAQQLSGWVREPGLTIDTEIEVIDGMTIRDDLKGVPSMPESYLAFPDGSEPVLAGDEYRTMYQMPASGRSQFGTFHVDYVSAVEPYPISISLAYAGQYLQVSPGLTGLLMISGSGTIYPGGTLVSTSEDFTRVKSGQSVNTVAYGLAVVDSVIDEHTLSLSGLPTINAATSTSFSVLTDVEIGDYVYIRFPSVDPAVIDYSDYPIRSGEVLSVAAMSPTGISVKRFLSDNSEEIVPLGSVGTFTLEAYLIKPRRPFSTNYQIPLGRTGRTGESVIPKSDDLRFMLDYSEVTDTLGNPV